MEVGGLCRGGLLSCRLQTLLSQVKFDGTRCVGSWVRGPHIRAYLSHRSDVLINALLVGGLVILYEGACTDLVIKYL